MDFNLTEMKFLTKKTIDLPKFTFKPSRLLLIFHDVTTKDPMRGQRTALGVLDSEHLPYTDSSGRLQNSVAIMHYYDDRVNGIVTIHEAKFNETNIETVIYYGGGEITSCDGKIQFIAIE